VHIGFPRARLLCRLLPLVTGVSCAQRVDPSVLYEGDSAYSHITVREEGDQRCLYFGRKDAVQSCIRPEAPDEAVFEYTQLMFSGLALVPEPRRVLMVGLGGGIVSGVFARHLPDVGVDIVEIDGRVVDLCRRWFQFTDRPGQRVHVGDGRTFVRRARSEYDLILLDAYLGDYIPFHLMTAEFLAQVREALAPGGAVVANVWHGSALFDAELRTFEHVFPGRVYVFRGVGNAMIVAAPDLPRRSRESLLQTARESAAGRALPFDLAAEVNKYEPAPPLAGDAPVLTDDRAPVHSLLRRSRI
jgi:spermidine synthase